MSTGSPGKSSLPFDLQIDVIVPVYRGLEDTRRCLESLLAFPQWIGVEIIVIDDASPEPALVDYLVELASMSRISLLRNAENAGFVATVNRGMALHNHRDVVLLNSDTQVAGDWLERLACCAYSDPAIGTATPFSNNATICSYPRFCEVNPLPEGWSLAMLDGLFRQVNAGQWVELPTGVGFCMYIRRDCLREMGLFDVANFGTGYGEENDFCMRATKAGWRNVLCADTFVYHVGGVSFGANQVALREAGMATLLRLHPDYTEQVAGFIERDPARPLRAAVDRARARTSTEHAVQVLAERERDAETLWGHQQRSLKTLAELNNGLKHAEALLAEARKGQAVSDAALQEAQQFVRAREADIVQLLGDLDQASLKIGAQEDQKARLESRIVELENLLTVIYASRSWRYTRMFRRS